MAYLYTPPQWKNVGVFEGSLRYGVMTSYSVYRKAGVWYATQSPGVGEIDNTIDVDPSGLLLFFPTPTIIPASLVSQLQAFNPPLPPGTTPGSVTTV